MGLKHILLVEDNPGDARLTREALKHCSVQCDVQHVVDGVQALRFLRQEDPYTEAVLPDLILLDLNLPLRNGQEVLEEVKADPRLKRIPVIILTTSNAPGDVVRAYDSRANAFVSKPHSYDTFVQTICSIEHFWLEHARLPATNFHPK